MITEFQGPHRWLSNFWPAVVNLDGRTYPTVEHAYQAAKFDNDVLRQQISQCSTPGQAKRLARDLRVTDRERAVDMEEWEAHKLSLMLGLLRQKFIHPDLRGMLIATHPQLLVEGNRWHDQFWGRCLCPMHQGQGHNHLGYLLMQVREDMRKEMQA